MRDIRFEEILDGDNIVFIQNERGSDPKLVYGRVEEVTDKSVLVKKENGEVQKLHRNQHIAKGDGNDGQITRAVVILTRADTHGDVQDFTGHPINTGDEVAFMEAPSQGFSTSLLVGEVKQITRERITIVVMQRVAQKYMRSPKEIVVIGKDSFVNED